MCDMNTVTSYSTFANAGFGLLGILIGSFISRVNGISFIKRQEFNKAASAFHIAFIDAIYFLRQNIDTGKELTHKFITSSVIATHEKAKIALEPFLSKKELMRFNDVWNKYKNYDYTDIPTHGDLPQINKNMSQFCLDQINNLLQYANQRN